MNLLKPVIQAVNFKVSEAPVKGHGLRSVTLDVIRGISIMLVLLHHATIIDKDIVPDFPLKQIRLFLCTFTAGGWSGVDFFFVLSGFLVSGLLFKWHY